MVSALYHPEGSGGTMMFRKDLAFALLLLVSGCVTFGEKHSTIVYSDPSKALVLVYRPHPPANVLLTNMYAYSHAADLFWGERKLVGLNVNSFTYVEVEPGSQTFSVREKLLGVTLKKLEFEPRAGQRYYLRYQFGTSVLMQPEISFRIVPNEIAQTEISHTRYVPVAP